MQEVSIKFAARCSSAPVGKLEKEVSMISAEVIKGVQELFAGRGIEQRPGEPFGDFVARGLGISGRQTEILLDALHDGHDVDDAARAAEIDPAAVNGDSLVQLPRLIGRALGRATPRS